MNATAHALRPGMPELPRRMRSLPINEKGYPVPFFVEWIDGKPDFRVMSTSAFARSLKTGACWLCGEPTGRHKTFVTGPMCTVTRTSSEPPCHHDCATFAVQACPFMILPKAKRRTANLPDHPPIAGFHIERNPGATALWTTGSFRPFNAKDAGGNPGILFEMGEPTRVEWYALGGPATRAQVTESIDSGMHLLWGMAKTGGIGDMVALENQYARLMPMLPA